MGCNKDNNRCNGINECNSNNGESRCRRKENLAKELACKSQKLQKCIGDLLEKAQALQEKSDCLKANAARYQKQAENMDKEANELRDQAMCLNEKLGEMMKKSDVNFVKAIDCYKEQLEDEDDFDCGCNW